jgi:DNA-binding winged helix-turn-helix (wHTH) protein/Flp pilus assembly protein TadD
MAADGRNVTYRFDEFELEPTHGTLRGSEGEDFALRPKTLALLIHLLDNPGRLIQREDLLDALWPNVAVTDDSLTQCISDLRHAFGMRGTQILRTIPRRGYMLAVEVQRTGDESTQPLKPADLRAERTAALVVAPFEHPGDDAISTYLATTMSTDLVTELAAFEEVQAIPATHPHAEDAFRVCGEVRPAGSSLRVSLRLESAGGATLWADRISVPQGNQPELDETQIGRLAVNLVRQVNHESLTQARAVPDAELTAWQLCLVGRDLHLRGTEADTLASIELLERAVQRDPDFAIAHAWLSFTVQRSLTHGWGRQVSSAARERSLAAARRAVQLEPRSPLCLAPLALALVLNRRWEEAVAAARAVVEIDRHARCETWAVAGAVLSLAGYHDEAVHVLQRVLSQDPLCPPGTRAVLGSALLLAGRPDEALEELRWCAAQMPDHWPCFKYLVVAAAETGHLEEAQDALRRVVQLESTWSVREPDERWRLLRRPKDRQRFIAAFRWAAGLAPEPATH